MKDYIVTAQLPLEIRISGASEQDAIHRAKALIERYQQTELRMGWSTVKLGTGQTDYAVQEDEVPF